MAFAGLGQFLAQWPRCPHFEQTSLLVFPLPLPLPFLPPFALGSFPLPLLHVLPAVLREVTESSARVALRVTVLLQCVNIHRCCVRVIDSTIAYGKIPMLLLLHARHPQALVGRVPTSGISQNSTTSASQALCLSLGSEQSPHTSNLRSSHLKLVCTTPDRARMPRASQACLQRNRIEASSRVALLFSTLMCGSYLSTKSCQARSPSADPAFTTRSRAAPEVPRRSK